jgi:hypothetical protein
LQERSTQISPTAQLNDFEINANSRISQGHPGERGNEVCESATVMIALHACPRCNGAVLEYPPPDAEGALCITCGWRQPDISPDVQAQIEAHLGKPSLEKPYTHTRIGRGKPALSGWERVKLQRERARGLVKEIARVI